MAKLYWRSLAILVAGTAAALVGAACYSDSKSSSTAHGDAGGEAGPCTQIPVPNGTPSHVSGTVVEALSDGGTGKPLAGAIVSVEHGGLYLQWCDMAHASPYYLFGALTDTNGHFEMDARQGFLGFHSFATGYYYSRGSLDAGDPGPIVLRMEPMGPTVARPAVTGAAFDSATVGAGKPVTFSATVTSAINTDPLSDELVLVEPTNSWSRELDPPSAGKKDDFPNGLWKLRFNAPDKPGDYMYYFSATTSQCVSTDVQKFPLKVQ